MENNEKKIDVESTLKNMLFFTSINEGFFNYMIPLKSDISKFNLDKSTEPSKFLFEYICYTYLKNIILSNKKINSETIIISDEFLCTENSKEYLIKHNSTSKKNIIICIQNSQNLKWTIIAFLNLEEQIKNYFDVNNKKPIKAKILSSNLNSDEDDIILNSTMDKLEYAFDFKSPENIQFEVDSFNICDQPNSGIFLLNFIRELMLQDEKKISEYIQKIYDEVSNIGNSENRYYFNIFNNISEEMKNINDIYNKELTEFMKNNKITEIEGNNNTNLDDNELNSDEEEEALKIMEKENEEAKILMRQNERKLRQKLYKQKLNDKNMIMYKEFGIIKEEDNESESESIDFFGKMKEKEEERLKFKESLNKKNSMNNNKILNNVNVNININVNNSQNIEEIKKNIFNNDNNDIKKKNQSKSEKNIKLNFYKQLEEALEEFELEQEPIKNTEENIKQKKDVIKNDNSKETPNKELISPTTVNKNNEKEKDKDKVKEKNKEKSKETEIKCVTPNIKETAPVIKQSPKNIKNQKEENKKEEKEEINNKKEKKKSNKANNDNNNKFNIFRNENIEFKKRGSVPKTQIKVKKLQLDFKYPNNNTNNNPNNKTTEKLKKSFTNTKRPDNKDFPKEKEDENNNSLFLKKKSLPIKDINNNKETIQISINLNNNEIKNIKNSTNKKEEEKNSKIIFKEKENSINSIAIDKEPKDNLSKKIANLNVSIKSKNLSKKNSAKINNRKINSKTIKSNQDLQPSITKKKSTSSSNKSEETNSLNNEREVKSVKNKIKRFIKQKESIEDKATINISATDNPINLLPPPKLVEKNILFDLGLKEKDNKDISSVNSTKKESDYSSNINIENIGNDFSETEKKSEFSDRSYAGRERIRKSNVKRSEKINPPGKARNSKRYEYSELDREDTNKICGCIGEQANGLCNIF